MTNTEKSLGLFVWYAIATAEAASIDRAALSEWVQDAEVDAKFLPGRVRAIDAFRNATTTLTDEYEIPSPGGGRGTWVRLVIRETDTQDSFVMRCVFRIATEPGGEPVERRVARLQFFRPRRKAAGRILGSEKIRTLVDQRLTGLDRQRVTALVKQCMVAYELNQTKVLPAALRASIRQQLFALGAVATADSGNGGNYLVPASQLNEVARLQAFIRNCGPKCRLRIMPLAHGDPDLLEMVQTSVDEDIEARALSLRREVLAWVDRNGRVAPSAHRQSAWLADYHHLQQVALEWASLEEEALVFERAAVALEQAMAVIEQVGGLRLSRRR